MWTCKRLGFKGLLKSERGQFIFNQYSSYNYLLPFSDFPQERCPVVLAPLLYPEKRDILMDRILPDSGGVAKTMMESSLADFMQEVGYGFCARLVVRHFKPLLLLTTSPVSFFKASSWWFPWYVIFASQEFCF